MSDSETTCLLLEMEALKERVKMLERELERSCVENLTSQADAVAHHVASFVVNGPNTLENFYQFDYNSIVTELQSLAPDLYQSFMIIGNVRRNAIDNEVTTEEIKAVTSLCSLLSHIFVFSFKCSFCQDKRVVIIIVQ